MVPKKPRTKRSQPLFRVQPLSRRAENSLRSSRIETLNPLHKRLQGRAGSPLPAGLGRRAGQRTSIQVRGAQRTARPTRRSVWLVSVHGEDCAPTARPTGSAFSQILTQFFSFAPL